LEVQKLFARLKERGIGLVLDKEAESFLAEKGYDPQYGARPMRRAVERYLEDPLAEEILGDKLHKKETVYVTLEVDHLVFHQKATTETEEALSN
ncbi:MAG TPA: ATP-dependent Clp protease ATP-binding subunit, partial [Verrucomicrobia bacterium]|nr:ATP-dependent Clp protease ATP-binding subunit [Verrucomicrobiota bacterium]